MRMVVAAVASLIAVTLCWAALAAAQQSQAVPGPGTGIVPVTGTVSIDRMPEVSAIQAGPWEVSVRVPDVRVANQPVVSVAPVGFLRKGGRYTVTWSNGDTETVTVLESIAGGWVRADVPDRRQRWINVGTARSVEDAP